MIVKYLREAYEEKKWVFIGLHISIYIPPGLTIVPLLFLVMKWPGYRDG